MRQKFTALTPALYEYVVAHAPPLDPVLRDLRAETSALGDAARMQIAVEQGAFLTLLARAIGARYAVEVGTFTGFSAIAIARGLPGDGRLLCCDVNEDWAAIARRHFARAGLADRITLRLAPALDTLRSLPPDPGIDLAFVDADKTSYGAYYDELLPRVRPNGLILFDNVLWGGGVLNDGSESAGAIRVLNDRVAGDARVESVMLPIADGLTIVRKR
jgi:caffeoyl-CoA O-methyltransferase